MDLASILGFIIGIASLVVGYTMDGGNLRALWLLSAMIITGGGAIGSVAIAYGFGELKRMPILFFQLFRTPKSTLAQTIEAIVSLSESARREGLLSVEKLLEGEQAAKVDPLLKNGMLMVIDGVDIEQIREQMETEIYVYEEKTKTEISTFDTLAAFAPAYGMIGTIVGLIQVLANISSPETMANAIAVAFITTLYGSLIANLICIPASSKLRLRLKAAVMEKEMIIEGVCAIRNGLNPKLLRTKLSSYLQAAPASAKRRGRVMEGQGAVINEQA